MEHSVTAKTTRITVETETLMVIRGAKAFSGWCPRCGAEVDVIALDEDNVEGSITASQIREWLGTNGMHFWQTAGGPAQICLTSLFQSLESGEVQRLCNSNQNSTNQSRRKQQ